MLCIDGATGELIAGRLFNPAQSTPGMDMDEGESKDAERGGGDGILCALKSLMSTRDRSLRSILETGHTTVLQRLLLPRSTKRSRPLARLRRPCRLAARRTLLLKHRLADGS
jgi:hypothetical protein